jgi:hypothetical protein
MPPARVAEVEPGEPRLPTFLVIGAPKAGTTSLHRYLGSHPDVFMSETKELNFFIADLNWSRGVDWYARHFEAAGDAKAIGEASPRYTQYPDYRGVAERAAALLPDAKLVYLVRDPLSQMLSHYADRRLWGSERRPVNKALLEDPVYLETARYAFQLEQFLAHFPRDRIHVVVSERLRSEETRADALAGILRFLGVDERWTSGEIAEEHNVGMATRRWFFQRLAATRSWHALAVATPGWLQRPLSPIVHRGRSPREELVDRVRGELASRLRDDLARLRELVGPEVDSWALGA